MQVEKQVVKQNVLQFNKCFITIVSLVTPNKSSSVRVTLDTKLQINFLVPLAILNIRRGINKVVFSEPYKMVISTVSYPIT
jgi:hypothetical protein